MLQRSLQGVGRLKRQDEQEPGRGCQRKRRLKMESLLEESGRGTRLALACQQE